MDDAEEFVVSLANRDSANLPCDVDDICAAAVCMENVKFWSSLIVLLGVCNAVEGGCCGGEVGDVDMDNDDEVLGIVLG